MSFASYLKSIGKFNTLTHKEFLTLLAKAQKGNKRARNKIIEHNLRLVVHIAKHYRNTNISIQDLIAEGSFGIFEAINKFNPAKKVKFSTYAVRWIKNKINRYIDTTLGQIRIPQNLTDFRRRLFKKPKLKIKKSMKQRLSWSDIKMASLNVMVGHNTELQDLLGTAYPITKRIDLNLAIEALGEAPPIGQDILKMKLAGMSLRVIGEKHNLSRERIRQIEVESIKKIKRRLLKEEKCVII